MKVAMESVLKDDADARLYRSLSLTAKFRLRHGIHDLQFWAHLSDKQLSAPLHRPVRQPIYKTKHQVVAPITAVAI